MSEVPTTVESEGNRRVRVRRQRAWSRFLGIALALHIPLFFYPILRLCGWLGLPWWATAIVFFPLAGSQVVSRLYLRGKQAFWARSYRKAADFWLGLSPIVLVALLVAEALVALTPLSPFVAAISIIVMAVSVGTLGVIVAVRPMVKKIAFESKNVRAPVRFVQITDVHIGSRSTAFLETVIGKVNRLAPDFLCITGDFIDAPGITEASLGSLKSVACPVYFCIGNHEKYEDLDEILSRLENLGVTVLRNDTTRFREDIQVIGIDDLDDERQVERQLRYIEVDRSAFALLLYHRPRGLEAAAEAGIDLMLSGHTHNGQIIPFNLVVGRVFDHIEGLHESGETKLYVSQGTGTWGPVMRVGTRSEITLFEVSPPGGLNRFVGSGA